MGFFGNYKKLHELSIDNQPQDDDEPTPSYTPEESDDEGDAGTPPPAEETSVEPAQEPAPAEEEPPADDGADPYAIPADDESGGEEPPAEGEEDPYAIPGEGEGDTGTEEEEDGAEGAVGDDDTGTEGDEVDASTGSTIASDLKSMEDEIFADLTDQQKDIRDNELKQNYILLYDTIDEAEKRINNIVKDEKTGRVLEFITRKMNDLKRLIHHNLTKVFDSRTYIENQTALQQCIAIMNTICNMLDSITEEDEDKNDE